MIVLNLATVLNDLGDRAVLRLALEYLVQLLLVLDHDDLRLGVVENELTRLG